ncbi:HECT-domain (ubiquitin-transferase) [Carpediemonas membranifera]|uniref:HECT-type E3 ubiquitin transferase n=1 Tax=Carpediemonas membranifera TaxID=201153 RepID=A0A8J6DXC1_9EUKA|nr:HECT-domain (ubiquitin-transferase) [Carpediemonas membranifera]|eukprot:KAG9389844.1 HECT-domain (ubiquitin-transferase) [Carpediemonas membranifera]
MSSTMEILSNILSNPEATREFCSRECHQDNLYCQVKTAASFFTRASEELSWNDLIPIMQSSAEKLTKLYEGNDAPDDTWFGLVLLTLWPRSVVFEPWYSESLLKAYCMAATNQIHAHGLEGLIQAYSALSNELMANHLASLHNIITVHLLKEKKIRSDRLIALYTVLRPMQALYLSNERRDDPLPYDAWHNNVVNEQVNLINDYQHYLAFTKGRGDVFSLARFPFILNAHSKVSLMRAETKTLQYSVQEPISFLPPRPFHMQVHRDSLVHDAIRNVANAGPDALKRKLRVSFIGEEGIDEGGVAKEFFQLIVRQLFDVQYGMFTIDEDTNTFFFAHNTPASVEEFKLVGVLLGLSVYNGIILDVRLPHVVYRMLFGMPVRLQDLRGAIPSLYNGLRQLLEMPEELVSSLALSFCVTESNFGETRTVDLIPDGASIPVTGANRHEYVEAYLQYYLVSAVQWQFDAFAQGFTSVAMCEAIKLFRPEELELAVCGSPVLDFHELEAVTKYDGPYSKRPQVVEWLWELVHKEMTDAQRIKFLSFVTGSGRAPTNGLGHLPFKVVKNGDDDRRLPTAHTCFNVLMLPEYSSLEMLRNRLFTAIDNAEGFGLR